MLTTLRWSLRIAVWAVVILFLHYTLPKREIVYITDTYNRVQQFGANSWFWADPHLGTPLPSGEVQRDVRFIDSIQPDGGTSVFRNEDTGFGWPPYFKFNSADLQAEAGNLRSTEGSPRWVAVTYYGWRSQWLTIFPNAVSIAPVAGPEVRLIPWFNIVFLLVLLAIWRAVTVRLRRFWDNRVDPALAEASADLDRGRAGLSRWFRR